MKKTNLSLSKCVPQKIHRKSVKFVMVTCSLEFMYSITILSNIAVFTYSEDNHMDAN